MPEYTPPTELAAECRLDDPPTEMDTDELVTAAVATARFFGQLEAGQLAVAATEEQTPSTSDGRLRRAWNALRGRDPEGGTDQEALDELIRTSEEQSETLAARLDDLVTALTDRLNTDETIRGIQ